MSLKRLAAVVVCWLAALGCDGRRPAAPAPRPLTPRVVQSFPAAGVTTVVLRAAEADAALVTTDPAADAIEVSGQPWGGASGYHSRDPNWKETPAGEWGLGFVEKAHGPVLVVSTNSEIDFVHHRYRLRELRVRFPAGVTVVRKRRELTDDGTPDLTPPLRPADEQPP